MAASAPYPRPVHERAWSVLAGRRLYLCTALSLAREPNNSAALSVCLRRRPQGTCAHRFCYFSGARIMRGQRCAWVPRFGVHDAAPATAADRRERPRAASSAATPEPVRECTRLAEPPTIAHRLGSARLAPPCVRSGLHPRSSRGSRHPTRWVALSRATRVSRAVRSPAAGFPCAGSSLPQRTPRHGAAHTTEEWHLQPSSIPECRRRLRASALRRAVVPHSAVGRQRSRLHVGNGSRP